MFCDGKRSSLHRNKDCIAHCFELFYLEKKMTRFNTTFTALAASLLLSGTAFAAGVQPAAGEGPFFDANSVATTSTVQRSQVRAAAIAQTPLAGDLPAPDTQVANSDLTRAQVRAQTREALANGFHVQSGNFS